MTRSICHDCAASSARRPRRPALAERAGRIAVDRVQHVGRPEPRDQIGGALGADMLDPAQVPDQRLGIIRRQRLRL